MPLSAVNTEVAVGFQPPIWHSCFGGAISGSSGDDMVKKEDTFNI